MEVKPASSGGAPAEAQVAIQKKAQDSKEKVETQIVESATNEARKSLAVA